MNNMAHYTHNIAGYQLYVTGELSLCIIEQNTAAYIYTSMREYLAAKQQSAYIACLPAQLLLAYMVMYSQRALCTQVDIIVEF